MCGIAGYHSNQRAEQDVVKAMTDVLVHRGPDASGVFCLNNFGLGHRRLSILDLSSSADQPMHSACGRYCISYNGEVYNYKEIGKELGIALRTTSDTEVIVEAFAKWGTEMVNRLNGMFAIAILDKQTQNLYLFRDRVGIKPLFIYHHEGFFGFASELKSLKANDFFTFTVNRSAIAQFLHVGFISEPVTIFNECLKFPAGHYGIFDGKTLKTEPYWQVNSCVGAKVLSNENEAKTKLRALLKDSVSKRLVSDVPFGTFLSGGVDSSLVTALAQENSSERIKTFSIGFSESTHDESKFAKQISNHLGTEHHEYIVSEQDALEMIPEMLNQYDEPYADSSAIPTMLVSKMARKEVTMTLSGDGGDELFHGYGTYRWAERLNKPFWKSFHNVVGNMLRVGNNRQKRAGHLMRYSVLNNAHILSQEQYYFSEQELRSLISEPIHLGYENTFGNQFNRDLSFAESQSVFDLKYHLKDDLLVKVDRASMLFSLETRVPLLDHRIIEFALNLAPELKVKQGIEKYLLKQLLFEFVPKELFDRPKQGFSIPLHNWLDGPLQHLMHEYLSEDMIRQGGIVNWMVVKNLIVRFEKGENYLYHRIWSLIVLHKWLAENR